MSEKKLYAPKDLIEKLVALEGKRRHFQDMTSQIAEEMGKIAVDGIRVWIEIREALGDEFEPTGYGLSVNHVTGEITKVEKSEK